MNFQQRCTSILHPFSLRQAGEMASQAPDSQQGHSLPITFRAEGVVQPQVSCTGNMLHKDKHGRLLKILHMSFSKDW